MMKVQTTEYRSHGRDFAAKNSVILLFGGILLFFSFMGQHLASDETGVQSRSRVVVQSRTGLAIVEGDSGTLFPLEEKTLPENTPFFFEPVPVNLAERELLMTLPGVGPGLADRIYKFVRKNGPITSPEQMLEVKGIGRTRLERIKDQISYQH